jgi:hypothetical protein
MDGSVVVPVAGFPFSDREPSWAYRTVGGHQKISCPGDTSGGSSHGVREAACSATIASRSGAAPHARQIGTSSPMATSGFAPRAGCYRVAVREAAPLPKECTRQNQDKETEMSVPHWSIACSLAMHLHIVATWILAE